MCSSSATVIAASAGPKSIPLAGGAPQHTVRCFQIFNLTESIIKTEIYMGISFDLQLV